MNLESNTTKINKRHIESYKNQQILTNDNYTVMHTLTLLPLLQQLICLLQACSSREGIYIPYNCPALCIYVQHAYVQ